MEGNIGRHLPLMANQKRLWILSQQDSRNPAYNILLTYHLRGKINESRFRKSLELLFEKHHTMFSVFGKNNDLPYIEIVPRQVILSECHPHLKFPYDFPRKKVQSGFGCREHFVIAVHDSENLREICRRSDATIFAALLSVMGLVFSKYSGENDICIGVPVSNRRSNPSLENIFGLFVSTVAVRLQHLGESSFREQLVSTREAVSRSVSHSALPFEKIVEELKPERIAGVNPFFQIALSWINTMTIPLDLNGIPGNRTTVNKGNSPFDISFYMWENGGLMTSSGKINRKNLPLPDSSNDRQTLIEPSTETEQRLLELWRALLKTENISTGDNFFDMGGNSILAINLANSVSKEFNVALKSLMIFEYPTIKDQSEFLSGIKEDIISQSNIELEEKIQRKKNVNFRRGRD